jgi:hypothetical protein
MGVDDRLEALGIKMAPLGAGGPQIFEPTDLAKVLPDAGACSLAPAARLGAGAGGGPPVGFGCGPARWRRARGLLPCAQAPAC